MIAEKEESPFEWKTDFETDYEEMEDIGRGRFSVVKKCLRNESKMEVAAKYVNQKLIGQDAVAMEISILQRLHHSGIVKFLGAYETTTSHVIILD